MAEIGDPSVDRRGVPEPAARGWSAVSENQVSAQTLLALLEGATFANALRQNGRPCPIRLPDEPEARSALVIAHVRGEPATLTFHAEGRDPWNEQVYAVTLAAFCPAADGLCRWVGIDLDASDHGERGLANPVHATRAIAERADAAGLSSGLLVARSRRGHGRHVFLLLFEPAPLIDAVIGVAALAAVAFKVAGSDATECGAQNAFRCVDGTDARPGDAGSVELLPYSTSRPSYGWSLMLPFAGALAAIGGGVIVDPFDDRPIQLEHVPRCDPEAWSRLVGDARAAVPVRKSTNLHVSARPNSRTVATRSLSERVHFRTREFLDGLVPVGNRKCSAFAASANLLGCGFDPNEAERMIMAGAVACGLPEREAKDAFKSALKAINRKGGFR
jgi:hypothetical protein